MFRVMADNDPRSASDLTERMLGRRIDAEDLPADLAAVESLFKAMSPHADGGEPSPVLLAAMASATRGAALPQAAPRRSRVARILTAKVAATAAVVAFTATGAAAATGSLPDAAQDGVAKAASHVGINLPDSASDRAREATENRGPDDDHGSDGHNHGSDVSGVATETDATGADKGAEISTAARDGHGKAHEGGSDDHSSVDTPNSGGTSTADEASDGKSGAGTDEASDAADAGSENSADAPPAETPPTDRP